MSIFTIYAPFLLILSIISVENINYYSCWQFTPVNLVLKWPRSGFRMSPVAAAQVPARNSLPRQKISTWNHNCQIRNNKLHYHIFLSSQTVLRNLNLGQITKKFPIQKRINTKKVKLKSQINSQMSQIQAKNKRINRNIRQRTLALQSAQINNNLQLNSNRHMSNLTSSFAGFSTPGAAGDQTNSVGEHLRIALPNTEQTTNFDTATQPPEEGEIQQQLSPAEQFNKNLSAAQINPVSPTTTNMDFPSPDFLHQGQNNPISINSPPSHNPDNATNKFSSHNDQEAQHSSQNYLQQLQNANQPIRNSHSNQNLPNSATNLSSHNNNDPTHFQNISQPIHNAYHANHTFNGHNANPQGIPLVLIRDPTHGNMQLSVLSAEHRKAWTQPSTCNANHKLQDTATTNLSQARTQPRFGGIQTKSNTANPTKPTQDTHDHVNQPQREARANSVGPFMIFNYRVINIILQYPTTNEHSYYQAALKAYSAIENLSAASISVYPPSEQGPEVAIWTLHDIPKRPKAEGSTSIGNTLPPPCTALEHPQTHPHPQLTPHHLPTHGIQSTPIHTHIYASEALYNLQIEIHGIAKFHLYTLEFLLLRTIQRNLTLLIAHTVLGPAEDPSDSHLPLDCQEWAIHDYVGDLCRPLSQQLDQDFRQFFSDLGDTNQRLLNPREFQPDKQGSFIHTYCMALRTIHYLHLYTHTPTPQKQSTIYKLKFMVSPNSTYTPWNSFYSVPYNATLHH